MLLITVDEYKEMGFPVVKEENIPGCIMRSCYIINGLTNGRAEQTVKSGGEPSELVKQAAGFQTYQLLREMEDIENIRASNSGSEKVTIGDYSYSTQSSESSSSEVYRSDTAAAGVNVIRLLRAAGCMFAGVEVQE